MFLSSSLSSPTSTMSITLFSPLPSSLPNKLPHFHNPTSLHLYTNPHFQQYPLAKTQRFTILPLQHHHPPRCSCSDYTPLEDEERELQEGIVDILLEAGVSLEEAKEVSLGAQKYGKMLRDGVRELDELNLWESYMKVDMEGGGEMTNLTPLSLKEKVKCVAKEKGDHGKIAFLESVGLSLNSAVHLARIVASQSLPSLIHKVKYVKEIFFSGSDERLAGKVARRMMLHLSLSVDEDVQQTLSFFEKIEARRGGLDMLGCSNASFRYLIESFPRLLLLSESRMTAAVKFMENVGVPKERTGDVLLLHPPLLFLDHKEVLAKLPTFEKVGALGKDVGKMVVKYPWVLSASILKNYEEILAFFETKKVPKNSINRAIRDWPLLLGCSSEKLKPMVEQFAGLGVRTTKLGKVIAASPQLLLRRPEDFGKVASFLQDLGCDRGAIGQILARCPEIFALRTVELLSQKLQFLTGLGILKQQQCRVVKKYPEFLVSDVDCTIMPRLRYLMNLGLSKRDVASMVVRFSPILGYSINEVLQPKLEFLVNTMGKPAVEVVKYPRYFSYSLEKKIKPRFFALSGRNMECSLEEMLSKNDEEFASDYVGGVEMFVSMR